MKKKGRTAWNIDARKLELPDLFHRQGLTWVKTTFRTFRSIWTKRKELTSHEIVSVIVGPKANRLLLS